MNSPEIQQFILEHKELFWYTPEDKKVEISEELLIETLMNYGTLDDIRKLFNILGKEHVANVFFGLEGRKRLNYFPEIHHFFSLVLRKYAPGNSKS